MNLPKGRNKFLTANSLQELLEHEPWDGKYSFDEDSGMTLDFNRYYLVI